MKEEPRVARKEKKTLKEMVRHELSKGPMSSRALMEHLDVPENQLLDVLHTMLREEEISRNQKNEYYIK